MIEQLGQNSSVNFRIQIGKIQRYPIFILRDVKTPVYKNAIFLVMPLRSTCFEDGFCNLQPLPFVRIIFHPAVHTISEWNPLI